MTRKLTWPDHRGQFVDRDTSRTPTDGVLRVNPGETIVVDDPDAADHYLDRGFQPADEDADATDSPGPDEPGDGEPMTWDAFQAMGYQDRVQAVRAGDVDHLLDRIADEDDSTNVQDAVEERQADGQG